LKLSKASKARLKRMKVADKKRVQAAALLLADCEVLTDSKYRAIVRALGLMG